MVSKLSTMVGENLELTLIKWLKIDLNSLPWLNSDTEKGMSSACNQSIMSSKYRAFGAQ